MSVEFYRGSPGKFDSRTLSREIISRWTGRSVSTPSSYVVCLEGSMSCVCMSYEALAMPWTAALEQC